MSFLTGSGRGFYQPFINAEIVLRFQNFSFVLNFLPTENKFKLTPSPGGTPYNSLCWDRII